MPIAGICRLCLKERDLCESHVIPKALYPTKNQKSATITRETATPGRSPHVKEHLLCRDCETKFTRNGESDVLKWLAPKVKNFPLADRLNVALPRERFPDVSRFAAYDLGLDAKKFAYFAVSVIWRAAVHAWTLPDGTKTSPLDLGSHEDIIRTYLLGETDFPHDVMAVIVLVCSDPEARQLWIIPCQDEEANCQNYRFIARGVLFRVMVGPNIPQFFRDESCLSPRECIQYGDCSRRVKKELPNVLNAPVGW
jgi:hypothetical protein